MLFVSFAGSIFDFFQMKARLHVQLKQCDFAVWCDLKFAFLYKGGLNGHKTLSITAADVDLP
jgi:hypothetical protein